MSLKTFINQKDVRERFKREFPRPEFCLKGELLAPPLTNHYQLVGIAFDYLLRFCIKRLNPNAITFKWIAEEALDKVEGKKILNKINVIIKYSKKCYKNYLESGELTDELLKQCILLAQLDLIYRSGGIIGENFGKVDKKDVEDLRNIFSLVKQDNFKAKSVCALNPNFGKASVLIGGADADVLIDDTLIDLKAKKNLELDREDLNQIIGYYFLFLIGGIPKAPKHLKIKCLGIYYARYGLFFKISAEDLTRFCKAGYFKRWFLSAANKHTDEKFASLIDNNSIIRL